MIFEQPAELNQLACPPIPWSMERIRVFVKALIPLVVFFSLFIAEVRFIKGLPVMPDLIGAFCSLVLVITLLVMLAQWLQNRCKRTLRLEEKGLKTSPRDQPTIRWSEVFRFQFEPTGPGLELTKFTIQHAGRSASGLRCWSMILPDATQREALLSELTNRRQMNLEKFNIEVCDAPIPPLKAFKVRYALIWLILMSAFLLMNGLPMLMNGLRAPEDHSRYGTRDRRFNPYVVQWAKEFSNRDEMRRFFVITGAILTGTGAVGIGLYETLSRRNIRAYRAELFGTDKIAGR